VSLKHTVLLISLLLCALPFRGWAETWESIRASAGTITSVETEFIQTKHLPILNKPLISKGKLWYQAPASLRWEYDSPIQSILLMHNGRVKRFTLDTQTHQFREESGEGLDAMQVVLGEISQWLKGRFDENPMFSASLESGDKIVLTPKQKAFSDVIQRIELYLDTQPGRPPGIIRRVLIYESETAYTDLSFAGTRLNRSIDESVFQRVP
jgi:outer membrane lipoprotein-sorting protein